MVPSEVVDGGAWVVARVVPGSEVNCVAVDGASVVGNAADVLAVVS